MSAGKILVVDDDQNICELLRLYIEKENFEHIQEIMKNAGELEKSAPYEKLVTTEFAKK